MFVTQHQIISNSLVAITSYLEVTRNM